jgi:hypothetical protein
MAPGKNSQDPIRKITKTKKVRDMVHYDSSRLQAHYGKLQPTVIRKTRLGL